MVIREPARRHFDETITALCQAIAEIRTLEAVEREEQHSGVADWLRYAITVLEQRREHLIGRYGRS